MIFIYGQEGFLIDQEVKRKIRSMNIDPIFYTDNDPIEDIILDITTVSLFSAKKLIVIKNHSMFNSKENLDNFINAIKNANIEIIFTLESSKIIKTNPIIKFLIKEAQVFEFSKIDSKIIMNTIRKIVDSKGGSIQNNALLMLSNKLPEDLRIIVNEVEKLLFESKNIDIEMVKNSVGAYLKSDGFNLVNSIISNDKHQMWISYNKKIQNGEDPIYIISQISSTLSLSLSVYAFRKQGYTDQDISDKIKVHIFRIKKAGDLLRNHSNSSVKDIIQDLYEVDKNIKTGKIESKQGLDHFFLKLIK